MLERGHHTSPKIMTANASPGHFYFGIEVINRFRSFGIAVYRAFAYPAQFPIAVASWLGDGTHPFGMGPCPCPLTLARLGAGLLILPTQHGALGSYRLINTKNRGSRL